MRRENQNVDYYLKCMAGGALSCGITLTVLVPSTFPNTLYYKYPVKTHMENFKWWYWFVTNKKVTTGWSPTLIGSSLLGLGRYGFY